VLFRSIGATGADDIPTWIATAPVWIPIVKEVVGIVRDAFKPGNTPTTTTDINTDSGSNAPSKSSMLIPVLLVGGAAAAYFIFAGKKKK
jgi:hypothetical protein